MFLHSQLVHQSEKRLSQFPETFKIWPQFIPHRAQTLVFLCFICVRKIAQSGLLTSLCLSGHKSVCQSACNSSAPTKRFSIKFDIWAFFRKRIEKI